MIEAVNADVAFVPAISCSRGSGNLVGNAINFTPGPPKSGSAGHGRER
jgi:hypothetical protein